MKIETVIFDWAGTTVDYGSFAPVQAFVEAFQAFGITPTPEEVREPMGKLKWEHIRTMMEMPRIATLWQNVHGRPFTKEDIGAVYEESERCIMGILPAFSTPKPFVLDTVAALRARGISIGSTTGYTDAMMEVVAPAARAQGYQPDCWVSPNSVENLGRPYPYMIFEAMKRLKTSCVQAAVKVGDTVADIREGKNAGMVSVGILEGSSVMGLAEQEYTDLSDTERAALDEKARETYFSHGADFVLQNMGGLCTLLDNLEETAADR